MRQIIVNGHQILGDGKTTWVIAPDGSTVGRYSRWGIDIHRPLEQQVAGLGECLDCSHHYPSDRSWAAEGWVRFTQGVLTHFGVQIPDAFRPGFAAAVVAAPVVNAAGPDQAVRERNH